MTRKKLVYLILELLFIGVAPLVMIFMQYGQIQSDRLKIGMTGILLVLSVFLILKKVVLRRYFENLRGQIVNFQSDLKTENDAGKIENIERELRNARTIETLFNAILPLVFLVLAFCMCKALEAQIMKLSGVIGFIGVSYAVGTVFSVLSAREVVGKNQDRKEKNE